jgi:hypothetical protein
MAVKLTQVKIKMVAETTVEFTIDSDTYEGLSEKDLENLAIAKLKNKGDVKWVCEDLKDKQIDLSKLSEVE